MSPPAPCPTPWAQFTLHAFVEQATGKEHLAMVLGDIGNGEAGAGARA
jgi:GTP cyclohydrolase II